VRSSRLEVSAKWNGTGTGWQKISKVSQNWQIALRRAAGYFRMLNNDSTEQKEKDLPPVGQEVLVQCSSFKCVGYRDSEGKWRDAFDGRELPKVIQIIEKLAVS